MIHFPSFNAFCSLKSDWISYSLTSCSCLLISCFVEQIRSESCILSCQRHSVDIECFYMHTSILVMFRLLECPSNVMHMYMYAWYPGAEKPGYASWCIPIETRSRILLHVKTCVLFCIRAWEVNKTCIWQTNRSVLILWVFSLLKPRHIWKDVPIRNKSHLHTACTSLFLTVE